jgi:hypothetical protein
LPAGGRRHGTAAWKRRRKADIVIDRIENRGLVARRNPRRRAGVLRLRDELRKWRFAVLAQFRSNPARLSGAFYPAMRTDTNGQDRPPSNGYDRGRSAIRRCGRASLRRPPRSLVPCAAGDRRQHAVRLRLASRADRRTCVAQQQRGAGTARALRPGTKPKRPPCMASWSGTAPPTSGSGGKESRCEGGELAVGHPRVPAPACTPNRWPRRKEPSGVAPACRHRSDVPGSSEPGIHCQTVT